MRESSCDRCSTCPLSFCETAPASVPCKATVIDNEGNRYPDRSPIIIDENTFVFGVQHGGYWKMISVTANGAKIENRFMSDSQAFTAETWAAAAKISPTGRVQYYVENVEWCTLDAGTPPVYICCPASILLEVCKRAGCTCCNCCKMHTCIRARYCKCIG